MILSSDELDILNYLKSWNGKSVSMTEICRCAGGRQKFKESPNWARSLMGRLVEAKLVLVNERGHYRFPVAEEAKPKPKPKRAIEHQTVGENYFPANNGPRVIGEDYFPASENTSTAGAKWAVSPEMDEALKETLKKHGKHPPE